MSFIFLRYGDSTFINRYHEKLSSRSHTEYTYVEINKITSISNRKTRETGGRKYKIWLNVEVYTQNHDAE